MVPMGGISLPIWTGCSWKRVVGLEYYSKWVTRIDNHFLAARRELSSTSIRINTPAWVDTLITWLEVIGLIGAILAGIMHWSQCLGDSCGAGSCIRGCFHHVFHAENLFVHS